MNTRETELIKSISQIAKRNNTNVETAMGISVLAVRLGITEQMSEYIAENPNATTDSLLDLIRKFCNENDTISDFEITE